MKPLSSYATMSRSLIGDLVSSIDEADRMAYEAVRSGDNANIHTGSYLAEELDCVR